MIALLDNSCQNMGSSDAIMTCHVRIIKVRDPGVPLTAGPTNVEKMPADCAAVHRHIKDVLSNAHRLNACVQDILCEKMWVRWHLRLECESGVPVVGTYPGFETRARLSKKLSQNNQQWLDMSPPTSTPERTY